MTVYKRRALCALDIKLPLTAQVRAGAARCVDDISDRVDVPLYRDCRSIAPHQEECT